MDITIKTVQGATLVGLAGDVDATTAPIVQEKVLPLTQPGSKILMDMTQVYYMSSAGLRMLLSLYRQAAAQNGKFLLVGLREEIQDMMFVTGFLNFFPTCETLESGFEALN